MKSSDELANEVEEVIQQGLAQFPLPYQKGNSIRVKNIVIRKHRNGYRVFDCQTNRHITTVFSKTAALAVAKLTVQKRHLDVRDVISIDNKFNKYYMDALYAKRTMLNTNDELRRENAEIQYDIACDKVYIAIDTLESYIFDK